MKEQGSYQVKTIASNVALEINRLKAQVELFWNKELKHYIEFGLIDGMNIVELGSGPGYVTEKLINNFPNIKITAVEIDPFFVEYARQYLAENNVTRCEVILKSIMDTGLPEGYFDFAIARLVLEHIPDAVNAIREILRILKPGGKAVFIDNDFEMHIMTYPHVSELRGLYDAYCQSRYDEGGNPKIGRELPTLLKKGGFSRVDFEVISAHSEIVGNEIFLKSEGIGIPTQLVHTGYLSSKALGKISIEWSNMLKSKHHSIIRQLYMAVGEKVP